MSKWRQTFDVFVGNLPHDVSEKNLLPVFTEVGEVFDLKIKNSKKNTGSKIAYVQYYFEPDADAAVEQRNGYVFRNCPLLVYRTHNRASQDTETTADMKESCCPPKKAQALSALLAQNKRISHSAALPFYNSPPNKEEQVVVSEIKDATSFFVQRLDAAARAIEVENQLAQFCATALPLDASPEFQKMYAARYSEDGLWYRCRLLQKLDSSKSYMQYVDYGNCEAVLHSGLVPLSGELGQLPDLALYCRLDGLIGVRKDENAALFGQAMEFLSKLLDNKIVTVQMKRPTSPTLFLVHCRLSDSGINVADELVAKGFAKVRALQPQQNGGQACLASGADEAGTLGSRGQGVRGPRPPLRAVTGRRGPPSNSFPQEGPPGYAGPHGYANDYGQNYPQHPSHYFPPHRGSFRGHVWNRGQDEGSPRPGVGRTWQPYSSGQLASDSSIYVKRLTIERDELRSQLQEKLSHIERLEKKAVEHVPDHPKRDFISRLSSVLALLEKSRVQREQFSTSPSEKDVLERALEARTSCVPGEAPSRLEAALKHYKDGQEAIRSCTNKAGLEELRAKRDEARRKLIQELETFQETAELQQQAEDAVERSQRALQELGKLYQPLLKAGFNPSEGGSHVTLEDLCQLLAQEKLNKAPVFQMRRNETDTAKEHFVDALQELQQVVRRDSSPSHQAPLHNFSLGFLEACLSNLQHSAQAEVDACNLVESAECGPLAALVQLLHATLVAEIEEAKSWSSIHGRYAQLANELSQEPNCEYLDWPGCLELANKVVNLRRSVRKLKSQLRHRLADLEDVEPNDEEEIQRISEEVAELRRDIHAILVEEEPSLDRLSVLQRKHYPELAVLHPDLNIGLQTEYGGLVKSSWDLSIFNAECLASTCARSVLKTKFLDDDMFLREYPITSGDGKHLMVARAVSYHQASSEHLLNIRAIFHSKDERHMYLLVPDDGPTLAEGISMSMCEKLQVLRQVLKALEALHCKGGQQCWHGAVQPHSVMLVMRAQKSGPVAILDLPEFEIASKQAPNHLPSLNGINFMAPELQDGKSQQTPASDMFAFGCLALWLLFPETSFKQTAGGVPDISCLSPASHIELATICSLIKEKPLERLTATHALETPLFANAAQVGESPVGAPMLPPIVEDLSEQGDPQITEVHNTAEEVDTLASENLDATAKGYQGPASENKTDTTIELSSVQHCLSPALLGSDSIVAMALTKETIPPVIEHHTATTQELGNIPEEAKAVTEEDKVAANVSQSNGEQSQVVAKESPTAETFVTVKCGKVDAEGIHAAAEESKSQAVVLNWSEAVELSDQRPRAQTPLRLTVAQALSQMEDFS